jgi:hypothetical protein
MSEPGPFFGGALPPPPPAPPSAYGPPAPAYGGDARFGPVPTFGAPAATFSTPKAVAAAGRPELVIVACTLLAVFAAFGLYVAAAASSLSSLANFASSDGAPSTGIYVVTWGLSGALNIALLIAIRNGSQLGRIVTSILCGLWTLYWLHYLVKTVGASSETAVIGGSIVGLAELFLVAMAAVAALPAVVLWLPSSKRHFS